MQGQRALATYLSTQLETQRIQIFDDPAAVVAAARRQRQQLKNPPVDIDRYLDVLLKQGLTQTTRALSAFRAVL